MEFGRFGGTIPGNYWGCCAADIIQNFNFDPDAKASIQLVEGDGGYVLTDGNDEELFAGPTYRDIFWQRLRFGTFGTDDMPNHAFLAIITEKQVKQTHGSAWLAILKEAGFEFIRTINNSVYTGPSVGNQHPEKQHGNSANYLFGMFRNIGINGAINPFLPPEEWTKLPAGVHEPGAPVGDEKMQAACRDAERIIATKQREYHQKVWDTKCKDASTLLTEKQLKEQDVPIWLSGVRSEKGMRLKNPPVPTPYVFKSAATLAPATPPAPPMPVESDWLKPIFDVAEPSVAPSEG